MDSRRQRLFWDKVNKHTESGCWEWTGQVPKKRGYGIWAITVVAHRISYELVKGPIPDGLVLDHLCRNRRCVNPDHLEPVTIRENLLRGDNWVASLMKQKACAKGHPLEMNAAGTFRICRICHAERMRKWRAKKKSGAGF